MTLLPTLLAVFLLLSWLAQLATVLVYLSGLQRRQRPPAGPERPKVCVLMPLRGADPGLPDALRSVLDQDYPNFELHIIVDDPRDPAWRMVTEVVNTRTRVPVKLRALDRRPSHRSLLCSSVLQFLGDLDDSCELIAFCAGDMTVPPSWLRDMVTAMSDPTVGGTLGNRWYTPVRGRWGSMVRYAWNAGAVVMMWACQIPWSGALMLRVADVRKSGLDEAWRRGMVEDVPAKDAIDKLGLRMSHVPQLTVLDDQPCTFSEAYRFIQRQLQWSRLYHRRWPIVVLHAMFGSLSLLAPLGTVLWALLTARPGTAAMAAACAVAYVGGLAFLVGMLDRANRFNGGSAATAARPSGQARLLEGLALLLAIPTAQLAYGLLVCVCQVSRHVTWRGIRYRLDGPWDIRMERYRPFGPPLGGDGPPP